VLDSVVRTAVKVDTLESERAFRINPVGNKGINPDRV
jgi:hypothetical protein